MKPLSARTKKTLKLLLKIAVSAAAICFVVSKIDVGQTWRTMCQANWLGLVAALVVYLVSQVLSAMRLNSLFKHLPLQLDTFMNIRLYWLGMFYNFFLPGGVGGDGYKVYYLNRRYRSGVKELVATMFGDRLSGLAAICCYLLLFLSFFIEDLPLPLREWYFLGIPIVLGCYYIFLRYAKKCLLAGFWRVIGYSFVVQGLQMTAAAFILFSLAGKDCPIDSYIFLFFVSSIASAIPFTLGGIGAREMAFVIGSQYLGTDEGVAVSLSLLFYAVSLISSLPGITFVLRKSLIEGNTYCETAKER